jgi:selenide,water dikinase
MPKRLTELVACAGCASKFAAGELAAALAALPAPTDPRVLVDFRTSDDAGVFLWESGPALVQTVDFFTPIVDDPSLYGEIAAANAVSDVYAMGGRPLTALAITAFPREGLDATTIRAIFLGGHAKLTDAGVSLLGGHSVQDPEIKFGYAITGAVDPRRVFTNTGAKPGDRLFLTKKIGTGVITTALKFERIALGRVDDGITSMRMLNRAAAEVLTTLPAGTVHACTDVTGFGLAGHGTEMAQGSGVTLTIHAGGLPLFEAALELATGNQSRGMATNRQYFGGGVRMAADVPVELAALLFDPQTSGGLLVSVAGPAAAHVRTRFAEAGVPAWEIGYAADPEPGVRLQVVV